MTATQKSSGTFKSMAGLALLVLGILIFIPKMSVLVPRLEETSEALKMELYNALPSIGLGLLHAGQTLAFEPRTFFAGVLSILVSFWPLLLVALGTALMRSTLNTLPGIEAAVTSPSKAGRS